MQLSKRIILFLVLISWNTNGQNTVILETKPEYPGGFTAFKSYLASEFKYPESARKTFYQGVVEIRLIIEKDGSGTLYKLNFQKMKFTKNPKKEDEHFIDEVEGDFEMEIIRLLDEMETWKPATRNGNPMKVFIGVPLR